MTPAKGDESRRVEDKLDSFIAVCTQKFDQITAQFEKIGRLEERIAAYLGIAERIEQANQQDVRELKEQVARHDSRLASLEATHAAHTARARIAEGAVNRLLIPLVLAVAAFLAVEWARGRPQVTVTSAPVIHPAPAERTRP